MALEAKIGIVVKITKSWRFWGLHDQKIAWARDLKECPTGTFTSQKLLLIIPRILHC